MPLTLAQQKHLKILIEQQQSKQLLDYLYSTPLPEAIQFVMQAKPHKQALIDLVYVALAAYDSLILEHCLAADTQNLGDISQLPLIECPNAAGKLPLEVALAQENHSAIELLVHYNTCISLNFIHRQYRYHDSIMRLFSTNLALDIHYLEKMLETCRHKAKLEPIVLQLLGLSYTAESLADWVEFIHSKLLIISIHEQFNYFLTLQVKLFIELICSHKLPDEEYRLKQALFLIIDFFRLRQHNFLLKRIAINMDKDLDTYISVQNHHWLKKLQQAIPEYGYIFEITTQANQTLILHRLNFDENDVLQITRVAFGHKSRTKKFNTIQKANAYLQQLIAAASQTAVSSGSDMLLITHIRTYFEWLKSELGQDLFSTLYLYQLQTVLPKAAEPLSLAFIFEQLKNHEPYFADLSYADFQTKFNLVFKSTAAVQSPQALDKPASSNQLMYTLEHLWVELITKALQPAETLTANSDTESFIQPHQMTPPPGDTQPAAISSHPSLAELLAEELSPPLSPLSHLSTFHTTKPISLATTSSPGHLTEPRCRR